MNTLMELISVMWVAARAYYDLVLEFPFAALAIVGVIAIMCMRLPR